jgi:hypothetical protein
MQPESCNDPNSSILLLSGAASYPESPMGVTFKNFDLAILEIATPEAERSFARLCGD